MIFQIIELYRSNSHETRGQVGIGTLIVFIAMVLVAMIAGGILIDTAGLLQSQAEYTGESSSGRISDRIQVFSSVAVLGGDDVDGNIVVREVNNTNDLDGRVVLEESLLGTTAEDKIDGNVVTEDGRNVVSVNGNIVTEDGENIVRESDGANVMLDEDDEAITQTDENIDPGVFRDPEFQGGTIRTTDDNQQQKRNVATIGGTDVTNKSASSDSTFSAISSLELTVGSGPGSGPIDLDDVTIQYLGPGGSANLVSNNTVNTDKPTFEVETIASHDSTVLADNGDRLIIVITLVDTNDALEPLTEGDQVQLTVVTGSGAKTTVQLTVPSTLPDDGAVRL